jgi:periplasmic protein TonB
MDIAISGTMVLISVVGIVAVILGIIFYMKMRYAKKADELKAKHQETSSRSLLEGRAKYPEVDIFRKSGTMFNFGLVFALIMIILAFNWTTYEDFVNIPDDALEMEEDIEIEPPRTAEPPPPPPPPPPPVIEEVPEEEIEEEDEPVFVDQLPDPEDNTPPPPVVKAAPPPPPPPPPPPAEEIFQVVEDMPRFPGCEDEPTKEKRIECANNKLLQFIYKNIKYPPIAKENGIEGTTVIQFVVDQSGKITEPTIVKDIGGQCGQEALRVVKLMNEMGEKWIPGKQRGRPVKVRYTLPVKFRLE